MFLQNFKVLCQVVPEKSLTKISIFITLEVGDSKSGKQKKKASINLGTLVLFSVIHLVVLIVYTKIEDSSTHRCWADMMEKSIGKKEKWTNKGTDKPYVADSLIHSTIYHT